MAAKAEGGAVARQGYLRKLKTMKKKYFVLREETADLQHSARLEYYESERKFRSGTAPRRVLPLANCYKIIRRFDLKQKHVIAFFTKEEQFCVVAEDEEDMRNWFTSILKLYRSDQFSRELQHPIQNVWQVNMQKKGLGALKNILGLYNLCLTDETLTLVKIKSHNNVISDLVIPERLEYSLKNIRRCGDSECFFYMEVGRQTVTGAGELWMHCEDATIARSMHSTIYLFMKKCISENDKDHVVVTKSTLLEGSNPLPARRQTYSDGRVGRAGLYNDKGLCVGLCIKQCVCAATYSIDDSAAAIAPLTPKNADNQSTYNTLTNEKADHPVLFKKHHRTESLPTGYLLFQEPPKIAHTRTRSEPLTGDELDRAILEKTAMHSSCKAVNGTDVLSRKTPWCRRASTGTKFTKLSPAHTKYQRFAEASTFRNRCVTMPSSASSAFEPERPPAAHADLTEGNSSSRDDIDSLSDWYRTPRIPEEPDGCDVMSREFMSFGVSGARGGSVAHSRTSSVGVDEADAGCAGAGAADGYLPMAPAPAHMSSSGSICSGTPSTDPRFSEYPLEPAVSHISAERCLRANSVGSRPPSAARPEPRTRAYSAGARARPHPPPHPHPHPPPAAHTAPTPPRASVEDLMELDFSANSPKVSVARTPPNPGYMEARRAIGEQYVDMSPRAGSGGYLEMRPGSPAGDGYVEMSYQRAPTRPIAIAAPRQPPPAPAPACSPDDRRRRAREPRTPLGSQTLFHMSMESPSSPPDSDMTDLEDDHHHLTTVRELSEDGRRTPDGKKSADLSPEEASSSPQYVTLRPGIPIANHKSDPDELPNNPTAKKTVVRPEDAKVPEGVASGSGVSGAITYAALDLQPVRPLAASPPPQYTQIDFLRLVRPPGDCPANT